MDLLLKTLLFLALAIGSAVSRTVRYKIITNEDGKKELVPSSNGTTRNPELDFLTNDLNITDDGGNHATTFSDRMDLDVTEMPSTESGINDDTYRLMKKWNSYTQNGWTHNKNAIYANSTKLIIFDDDTKNHSKFNIKQGKSENLTADEILQNNTEVEDPIVAPGFWDLLDRIYTCFNNSSKIGGTVECLKARISSMILRLMEGSLSTSRKGYHEKTLLHGKKLLKGALLPLLVLLVIKYLIALPVIAVGLITIKTFWLSLMSAGVAAFGNPWKKGIIPKRYEAEPVWDKSVVPNNAWAPLMADGHRNGEYFM